MIESSQVTAIRERMKRGMYHDISNIERQIKGLLTEIDLLQGESEMRWKLLQNAWNEIDQLKKEER